MPGKRKRADNDNIVAARFTDLIHHPETAFSGNKARLTRGVKRNDWLKTQPAYILFKPSPHEQGTYQGRELWREVYTNNGKLTSLISETIRRKIMGTDIF